MSEPMKPERKRATLLIVVIFLCGVVTGALAGHLVDELDWDFGRARADTPRSSVARTVERFRRDLNLTPEQTRQLNEILDQTHASYREHEAAMEAIRLQGRDRIRAILTPEQKATFEEIIARRDSKRRRRR